MGQKGYLTQVGNWFAHFMLSDLGKRYPLYKFFTSSIKGLISFCVNAFRHLAEALPKNYR